MTAEDAQSASAYQDAERFLKTQVDVLRSRRMAERVIAELRLVDNDNFINAMRVKLPDAEEGTLVVRRREAALKALGDNLVVFLPADSRVVSISFTSPDPKIAARIANTYSGNFMRYNVERRFDSSSYARDFLGGQLRESEVRLQRAERDANAYARSIGLIRTPNQNSRDKSDESQTITTASLIQLNTALIDARARRIEAQSKWNSIANAPDNAISDVVGNKAIQDLYAQRALADAQLQSMLSTRQEDYPGVAPLREQVRAVDRQIASLASGIRLSIRNDYRSAARQEAALSSQVAGLKSETLTEQDRSVRYNILAREVDTSRELYNNLLQRFREVSAEAGITNNNVLLIDSASVPVRPSSPRPLLNLALAILAGLGISGIFIFLREQLDDRVRNPAELESKLGLKLMGLTPKVGENENPLELIDKPFESLTESFYALRANLQFSAPGGTPSLLFITSAQPAEGKSTTSYGIARSIAQSGKRTILIDCDLRRPSVHKVVEMENEVGDFGADWTSRYCGGSPGHNLENMDVMTSGPLPPSPKELLASPEFMEMCANLTARYDHVIIDGPPVLGLADAPIYRRGLAFTRSSSSRQVWRIAALQRRAAPVACA
ncbi:MAG: polysaccharide biosynthesis tyrosine autokinase [Sphingomonadales bacterium]|nr:polysaccharide biosynthesis tyrosine autokinase [Sphingomonadales bacterium]